MRSGLKDGNERFMTPDNEDFYEFINRREQAAQAYVNGDAAPVEALTSDEAATFFSPRGDVVEGPAAVKARYVRDAAAFAPGGETHFEVLQVAASGELGYLVGLQKATAHLSGEDAPVRFDLRITEIYGRQNGVWKLLHRHADQAAPGTHVSSEDIAPEEAD